MTPRTDDAVASVCDIRRGDHFTWNGQAYLAHDDARPTVRAEGGVRTVDIHCVPAKNIKPGPDGVIDLGTRLRDTLQLAEWASVEITRRGSKVTWFGDQPSTRTPAWQAKGVLGYISDARRRAQRAVDDPDESRDNAIRQAIVSGIPVAQIAEMTGMSRVRIYQIRDGDPRNNDPGNLETRDTPTTEGN